MLVRSEHQSYTSKLERVILKFIQGENVQKITNVSLGKMQAIGLENYQARKCVIKS